jgi:septal ring factor EnvC (AmiA/AmiB activator)
MTFLINNIIIVVLIVALLIQLVYWVVDKIKTKGNIEKLREEMRDGIIGVKRHDKDNQQNSLNIVTELMRVQEEKIKSIEEEIKNVENKIENIEKNLTYENNNKAN